MPSILSSCLVLLKIAMAVNEGLHSMLSSIYSILENVLNSDHGMEPLQGKDSAPVVHCSKSRILEAFNRRRANLPIFEQTEVYVSNMNPYQEITITNKDYDGNRKKSSPVKKSQCKGVENPLNPHDVPGNEEIFSSCPENSQTSTPSLVSSDTENESEYQYSKTLNCSVEQEENIVNICVEDEPGKTNDVLGSSTDEKTSVEGDQSPNSSFLEDLQSQIKFTSQTLQRALMQRALMQRASNVKSPSTKNAYGLTDSESMDSTESTSEVCTSSSPEVSACRKEFFQETARLYENFRLNYYSQNKDTNFKSTPNKRGLQAEACISNVGESTLEESSVSRRKSLAACDQATSWQVNESQQKQNTVPSITITTKHINTYQLPLSLQKDRWIEMDGFEQSKIEDSNKLYQNAELLKRNTSISSEQTDVNQSLVNDDISSSEDGKNISVHVPKECQSSIKRNLSSDLLNLKGFSYSDELDIVSLERVDLLKKVLQNVGATDALEDLNVDEHHSQECMLNFLSKVENSYPEKCTVEESAPMQTHLLDVDHIPLKELDTNEKQITYLNKLTKHYMDFQQKSFQEIENELLDDLEERHKIILDTITNGYKNRLDSITRNAGMCLNELCSINTDLKTKFGFSNFKREDSSAENCLGECVSPQKISSEREIQATGLSPFMPKKSTTELLELVENENVSMPSFKYKVDRSLETENSSRTTFNLDNARNETSTPIKEEKINDHVWVSINLSSRSQNERSMNGGKDSISSICDSKLRRNILGNDHELSLFDSRQEHASSDSEKEDIILEAEDWKNIVVQMATNYEKVVSLLNSIDEGENFSVKNETDSSEDEDCNPKPGMADTETISKKVLNYYSTPKEQTEPSETSIDDTNRSGESNSDNLNTSNESLLLDSWSMLSNARATLGQEEIEMKKCLQKENLVNENISLKTIETQMEIYNYPKSYLNSTDKNSNETKLQLLKLATDSSKNKLKFLDIKSKSPSSSENEENCSDIGRSTPVSNMYDLIKREELETVQIYDDLPVWDKVENRSHSDNLSTIDDSHNLGTRSEDTLFSNEDKNQMTPQVPGKLDSLE